MPRLLRLNVLGRPQMEWSDGEPLNIASKKALALLAFLAVEGRPQPRERLAALLWGGTGEERARHNLRQALSKIRQCCDDLVTSDADCLELDPDRFDADVARFTALLASEDLQELRECLDLYRGELLEGRNPREPEYAEWLGLTRSRLRNEACKVAARLAAGLADRERPDDAIVAYADLLAIDPAHEPAHRELMVLLAQAGRRSDALRQYNGCVEALERELGVEPSADTKALYAQLKEPEPQRAANAGTAVASGSPASGFAPPSVAVLPFDNLSSTDDAYFADGITEDFITALSCFHSVVVIARGSSFAFRDSSLSDKEIAAELGAHYLVRGSVQRAGNRVRVNVQLLDAAAGLHVWGHRYDREMEDVFVLQDEITSILVSTLAGRVEAARLAKARKAPAERLDAHDLLLRGKDHHHRFTAEDCALCIEMFNRAIERDPTYAVAYAWLACGLGQAMVFGLDDIPALTDRCQAAAEKGLELDPDDCESHRVLAQVNLTRGNMKRALQHQDRSLFLNPNDDRIVNAMGEMLVFTGKAEEAEQWIRKSMRLNPYHPQRYWTHLVRALFHQERYAEALEALEHISKPRTDDLAFAVAAAVRAGRDDVATASAAALRAQNPDFDPAKFSDSLPYQQESDRTALLEPLADGIAIR